MKKNVLSKVALAALAAAGGTAVAGHVSVANAQATINSPVSGAPEIREGQQRFRMRGRFQYDVYSNEWDGTNLAENGTRSYVRRAFIGVQGRMTDHWRYKVDFVLAPGASGASSGSNEDEVAVDDAYIEYAGDFYSFVFGENNVTSPLEDRTSSLDIPFAERSSFVNAFGYGRAAGAAFLITGANWMGAVGVYGDSLNNQDNNFEFSEQNSVSGRFTWAPIFESSPEGVTLLHLGVSARARENGEDGTFQYRPRPLNGRGDRHIEATALGAQSDISYGAEIAGQWNAFGFTAEYSQLTGETGAGAEFEYDGYYVDVHWSLTGEPRVYRGNQGSFGPIVPRNSMLDGGLGHWMLSARYDFVDMTDPLLDQPNRGEQSAYAVGLDWIPVDHVRFKLNYAHSEMDRTDLGTTDAEADVITLRTQFDF
jgi:phosphate-selective porin OprO and OprP